MGPISCGQDLGHFFKNLCDDSMTGGWIEWPMAGDVLEELRKGVN